MAKKDLMAQQAEDERKRQENALKKAQQAVQRAQENAGKRKTDERGTAQKTTQQAGSSAVDKNGVDILRARQAAAVRQEQQALEAARQKAYQEMLVEYIVPQKVAQGKDLEPDEISDVRRATNSFLADAQNKAAYDAVTKAAAKGGDWAANLYASGQYSQQQLDEADKYRRAQSALPKTSMTADYFTQGLKNAVRDLGTFASVAGGGINDRLGSELAQTQAAAQQLLGLQAQEKAAQKAAASAAAARDAQMAKKQEAQAVELEELDERYSGRNTVGDALLKLVAQGVGGMVPTLAAGALAGPMGYAVQGAQGFGSGYSEATADGANKGQAGLMGLAKGGLSMGTEALLGGIPGLDDAAGLLGGGVEALAGKAGGKTAQAAARWGLNALGEGAEEVTEEALNELAAKLIYGKQGSIEQTLRGEKELPELFGEYGQTFAGGALVGGALNAAGNVVRGAMGRNSAPAEIPHLEAEQTTAKAEQGVPELTQQQAQSAVQQETTKPATQEVNQQAVQKQTQQVPELEADIGLAESADGTARLTSIAKAEIMTGKSSRTNVTKALAAFYDKYSGRQVDVDAMMQDARILAEMLNPKKDYYYRGQRTYDTDTWQYVVDNAAQEIMLSARFKDAESLQEFLTNVHNEDVPELEDEVLPNEEADRSIFDENDDLLPEHAIGAHKAKGETLVDSQTNSIRAAARAAGADAELEADLTEHMHAVRGIGEADANAKALLKKYGANRVAETLVERAGRDGGWGADDATLAWHTMQEMTKRLNEADAALDEPLMIDGKNSGMTVREDLAARLNALTTAFADQNTKAGQYMGYLGNKTKELNAVNILVAVQQALNGDDGKATENGGPQKQIIPKKQLTPEQTAEITQLAGEMEKLNRNSREFAQKKDRVVEIMAEAMGPTSWQKGFSSFAYVSMLSNILKTGSKNVIGNASSGALYRLKNSVVKPALEKAMQATGLADKIGYTKTSAVHAGKDVRSEAYKVYEAEAYGLVNGPGKYDTTGAIQLEKSGNTLKDLKGEAEAARKQYAGKLGKVGDAVQWLADAENQTYSAQDELGAVGTAELLNHLPGTSKIAQAMKNAAQANAAAGKTGLGGTRNNFVDALARAMQANGIRTAAELDAKPELKEKLIQYAVQQAQEATFHDTNAVSNKAVNISKTTGVLGRAVLPFAKTPANVAVRAVEYSPLGLGVAAAKGKKGNVTGAVDALAKSLTGSALMALGYFAGKAGLLKGSQGDDRKDRYEETAKGAQGYSLDIGELLRDIGMETDFDASITVETLSPAILPMLVGASLWGEDGNQDWGSALMSVLDPMLDMTFLSGLADVVSTIRYSASDNEAVGAVVLSALANVATQYIPTVLKQAGRSTKEYRQSYYSDKESKFGRQLDQTAMTAFSWVPELGDELTIDYVDQWGRKQENVGGNLAGRMAYNMLSPSYYAQGEPTAVDEELEGLYYDLLDAGATESEANAVYPKAGIVSTESKVKVNGAERRLTQDEMEAFAQVKGQTSYKLVESLLGSTSYDELTAEQKAKLVGLMYDFAKAHGYSETVEGYSLSTADAKLESLYDSYGADGVVQYRLAKVLGDTGSAADPDGGANNSLSQAELKAYLDAVQMLQKEKASIWAAYFPNAKTKPYK